MEDMSNPCCISQRNQKFGMFSISAWMPISAKFITDLLQLDWQGAEKTLKNGQWMMVAGVTVHPISTTGMSRNSTINVSIVVVVYLKKHSRDTRKSLPWGSVFKTKGCCSTTSFPTSVGKSLHPGALSWFLSRYSGRIYAFNLQAGLMRMCANI